MVGTPVIIRCGSCQYYFDTCQPVLIFFIFYAIGVSSVSESESSYAPSHEKKILELMLSKRIRYCNEKNLKNQTTKEVAFADDITAAGKTEDLKCYRDEITTKGTNYGYYPKASKSHLIVKEKYINKATNNFQGLDVQITTAGERHLGQVIGSIQFREKYVTNQVGVWNEQLIALSNIAEIEPQVAYVAFVSGFKHKLIYFMRTIPDINTLFTLIEETIRNRFIPAITGGHVCSNLDR